jgi:hypothetical protein
LACPYEDANDELLEANATLRWHVGRPMFHDERNEWQIYAFDPKEVPKVGWRQREWTAVGPTEERCIRTMAYCLREIGAGRVPK